MVISEYDEKRWNRNRVGGYPGLDKKRKSYPRFHKKCHWKISSISRWFSAGLDRLWLFNVQSAEQPVQLPPGNCLSFWTLPWPTIASLCNIQSLVKEHISIRFTEQDLDPVTPFTAEKEQGWLIRIHGKFVPDNAAETIDRFAHVCCATYDIDVVRHGDIA